MSPDPFPESDFREDPQIAPSQAVGRAIQDLTAARLGRGFLAPAALTLVGGAGLVYLDHGAAATALVLGGPSSAVAMLAYGLRTVQRAFGRAPRAWMHLAAVGSVVPPGYAIYALGWHGLRSLAGAGPGGWVYGLVTLLLGIAALRSWLRILEVERLARTMVDLTLDTGHSNG